MSHHIKFQDYTDVYCPETKNWADLNSAGDKGPSDPICSECGDIVPPEKQRYLSGAEEVALLERIIHGEKEDYGI